MRNQTGFLVGILVIFLPLMLLIFAAFSKLKALIHPDQAALHECRISLLSAQAHAATSIQEILDLNSEVEELRVEHLVAQAELDLALAAPVPQPEAVAAAELELRSIEASQIELGLLQKTLITEGNERMALDVTAAEARVREQIQKIGKNYDRSQSPFRLYSTQGLRTSGNFQGLHLAVDPVVSDEPGPPTYKLADEFSSQQKISVSWQMNLQTQSLQKVKPVPKKTNPKESPWNSQSLEKSGLCSASLKSGNPSGPSLKPAFKSVEAVHHNSLSPVLMEDKS
jgi:hypothetical protein